MCWNLPLNDGQRNGLIHDGGQDIPAVAKDAEHHHYLIQHTTEAAITATLWPPLLDGNPLTP